MAVLASVALALVAARGRARDAHRSRRDPRHHARHRAQLPGSPCLAVSRTTGFQVKVGNGHATR